MRLKIHFSPFDRFFFLLLQISLNWNVTPLFFEGGGRYSFAKYFASPMQLLPSFFLLSCTICLLASPSLQYKGSKCNSIRRRRVKATLREQIIHFWGILQVETLFQKLWALLYKRAKLDLRSTKLLIQQILFKLVNLGYSMCEYAS